MADNTQYEAVPHLDEIVFEHRNKEYGAYDLRKSYPRVLTRSFIIGTGLFLVTALTPLIYATIQKMNAKEEIEVQADLINLDEDPIIEEEEEIKEETPPPPPPKEEEQQEIIQNVVPEPVKAPKVETPPPPITTQLETTTGLVNQEGVQKPTYTPPPPPVTSPTGTKGSTAEVPKVDPNKVFTEVEQVAEFPGGIDKFRRRVQDNFDSSVIEGEGGVVSAEVSFVVEKDGSITDVKASGPNRDFNNEAVRTVKSIKNKWAPAKVNGQNVRYRFKMPLKMQAPD